jgi:dipeptidase E
LLYFHSDPTTPHSEAMDRTLASASKNSMTMAYFAPTTEKKKRQFESRQEYYAGFGVHLFYVDLNKEYDAQLVTKALKSDAILLPGGHTGELLDALLRCRLLVALRNFVAQGGVLCGISAGAILMTPTIRIASSVPAVDKEEPVKNPQALGLVDFEFYPHFGAEESATDKELMAYAKRFQKRILACDDGSGIVVSKGQEIFYGEVFVFDGR